VFPLPVLGLPVFPEPVLGLLVVLVVDVAAAA